MARDLGLDGVVDHFTLIGHELDQLRNKSGATRLGSAVVLKFLLWRGRFPQERHELPEDAVAHLARQVRVPATELAYGTNTGVTAVAAGEHGHTEADLRYTARRHFTIDGARAVAVQLANATFAARQAHIWGQSTTTVASDSTHFRAYDQNLFTEWHSRYGGRGVLIYWHIEKKSMAVHSQLISCAASEVAAMIEGAVRYGTTMALEGNDVDSHGQTEIGFAISLLLGFDLLPRIKQINKVKLYQPDGGNPDAYPQLKPAMTRPIRWELIEQNFDQMIKYATAIMVGTASTEAILRRFTRNASHPVYQAMLELAAVRLGVGGEPDTSRLSGSLVRLDHLYLVEGLGRVPAPALECHTPLGSDRCVRAGRRSWDRREFHRSHDVSGILTAIR